MEMETVNKIHDDYEWSDTNEDLDQIEHEDLLNNYRKKNLLIKNNGEDLESFDKRQEKIIHNLSKKYDLESQPIFHDRRGLYELVCCCLSRDRELTKREVKIYEN